MALVMYSYPTCGTCRKAKKFLEEYDIKYEEKHIVQDPPSSEDLRKWIQMSQLPLGKFFNTSGKRYRELELSKKRKQMNEEEQFTVLSSDPMLLKRPIVTDGEKVTVGFNEKEFQNVWLA